MAHYSHTVSKVFENREGSRVLIILIFILILLASPGAVRAQKNDKIPKGVVPPPFSLISKSEKKQLNAQPKPKKRTSLSLSLMAARLMKSEKFAKLSQFQRSINQLGSFEALMHNALKFMKANQKRRGSHKNFKKFEMTLRKFIPKLELVRRKMPFKYGYHVSQLIKTVRKARSIAIEPLYDDTVIPQGNR